MNIKFDTINIIIILVTLINTIYGLVVYSRNRSDKTNFAFFILTLAVSFWDISMFAYRAVDDPALVLLLSRILYVAASTIPISFLYFVFIFPSTDFKLSVWKSRLLPVPFLVSCVISFLPGFLIERITFVSGHENIIVFNPWLHAYYALYIILYFSWGYILLYKKYISSNGILKIQVLFTLVGTLVSTSIGVLSNLTLLLFFNNFSFNWLGQVGTVVMIVSISYAILKHHLFNVRVIATELFTFSLWTFILIRTVAAQSLDEQIINGTLLFLVIVVGIFLIQSVRKEVHQRERIELLATDLEKANVRLTELDRQKSEFVSFASHQLRAPLTAMKGYGSLLLEGDMGPITPEVKSGVQHIYDSTNTLVSIVNDYLNVSRIELGTMKYAFETVDLKTLIEDVIAELKPSIDQSGLQFAFKAEANVDFHITADRDKLKQVFVNIIDNSMKYTPKGSVAVSLTFDRPRHKFIFMTKDTGIGINPETIPHLFQKFSRAQNANKTNIKGTGLGLYVVKEMVEAHHGTARVESPGEGKGSSFIVELDPFSKA